MMKVQYTKTGAWVDGPYRYSLMRRWTSIFPHPGECITWVMLNPSVADAREDDPTIRRVVALSNSWGYQEARIVNLFAFRATHPAVLLGHPGDIVGPENNDAIRRAVAEARAVVCAWGANAERPAFVARAQETLRVIHDARVEPDGAPPPLFCLWKTDGGSPVHPLQRARKITRLLPYKLGRWAA